VHPSVHQRVITDPAYERVFAFAGEKGMPVLTHTWVGDPHCSPELCADAAERFPSVTFVWGHSGGSDQKAALELAAPLPNVYLELACSTVFYGQLEHMLKRFPAERILYGSDFCFISLPQQLAKVALADVSDAVKSLILRENSARILEAAGIPAP
ncbi:MAG: amidohydrolase family protein, partial [Planctomycetota bacterium]